ncbi:DUF4013 domain-containing protein [Halobellus sp. Atlit-38R]|uniref:DUF4013 domain-containing protein n=1 Tax=Halobellus sp. Atlit-38R TaxID=2282131 RepID=UPI000EF1F34A|nr:DUF4013 domain-containing protein [Halobellus sp. Atlit-38R]RLM88352.1 DUF4013 domain-containing protein [Halobellus sp. Atlit-38R]
MLSDALHYPLDSDDWLRTILIGGLLSVLSVLVLPVPLLQGYYVRVLRGTTRGDAAPPAFDEWGDLFVDGLKLIGVNIAVSIVVVVAMFVVGIVTGFGSAIGSGAGPVIGSGANGGLGGLGGLLTVVAFFAFVAFALLLGYVAPAMFANFAREDSMASAFDVSTVLAAATTADYLIAWVLAVVVALVLGTIASLLGIVVVGIFALFYVQVVTYYLFGRGFADGLADAQRGSL